MRLKLKDEVKHLREIKCEKDEMRSRLRGVMGKTREFTNIMKDLRRELEKRKKGSKKEI